MVAITVPTACDHAEEAAGAPTVALSDDAGRLLADLSTAVTR